MSDAKANADEKKEAERHKKLVDVFMGSFHQFTHHPVAWPLFWAKKVADKIDLSNNNHALAVMVRACNTYLDRRSEERVEEAFELVRRAEGLHAGAVRNVRISDAHPYGEFLSRLFARHGFTVSAASVGDDEALHKHTLVRTPAAPPAIDLVSALSWSVDAVRMHDLIGCEDLSHNYDALAAVFDFCRCRQRPEDVDLMFDVVRRAGGLRLWAFQQPARGSTRTVFEEALTFEHVHTVVTSLYSVGASHVFNARLLSANVTPLLFLCRPPRGQPGIDRTTTVLALTSSAEAIGWTTAGGNTAFSEACMAALSGTVHALLSRDDVHFSEIDAKTAAIVLDDTKFQQARWHAPPVRASVQKAVRDGINRRVELRTATVASALLPFTSGVDIAPLCRIIAEYTDL